MTPTTETGAFALRFLLDAGIAFGFKVVPDGAAKMIAAIEAEARAAALRDLREKVEGLEGWFSRKASCCSWTIGAHYNLDGTVGGNLFPPHEPVIVPEEHGGLITKAAALDLIDRALDG